MRKKRSTANNGIRKSRAVGLSRGKKKSTGKKALQATGVRLAFDQVQRLVSANNKSHDLKDNCVISVCWKESSFDPSAHSGASTAKGLMQMTDPAVDTVNRITPAGVHFQYADMLDGAKAIQCGTYYLQWCFTNAGNDERKALDKFAGVNGYATDVITAESCLSNGGDPMTCLRKIHPFLVERLDEQLVEDPTGESRFKQVAHRPTIDR